MTRSISFSRPMTGSSLPSRAAWVRLRPNWSSTSDRRRRGLARGGAGRGRLLALVAGEQLDDLLADPVEVGAELDQHLGGDALALTDQAEQDVLGADVVVAELQRLAQRQLEHLLGPRRERDVPARRLLTLADDLLDLLADALQGDAEALQRLRRDALTLVDQAEQDVLRADVVVVEHPGLFLSQDDNPSRSVGEPLEHALVLLTCRAPESGRTSDLAEPAHRRLGKTPAHPHSIAAGAVSYGRARRTGPLSATYLPTLHAYRVFPAANVYAQSEHGAAAIQ